MAEMLNKLPPQNVEAEQSVLGALMLDPGAILKVADTLRAEDFYRQAHQLIYRAMLDLFKKNEPIDLVNLVDRLTNAKSLEAVGGSAYLSGLVNAVPAATHVQNYARIVREKKVLRDLIDASSYILNLGYQEDAEVDALIDEAEQRIFRIAQRANAKDFLHIDTLLQESFQRIDRLHEGQDALRGIPTGFNDLDRLLSGLQRSDLVILAARPGMGKSSLAMDMARRASKKGAAVGIFSLEMSKDQLVDRLLAAEAEVDLWRLRTGQLHETDFPKLQEAFGALAKLPIYIDDTGSSTILEMRALARRLQQERGLDLLVVDYLQLMRTQGRIENRVQEISEISRSLKALARELNIPVVALSQLSRGVEHRPDHRPKLADLRDSGCLTADTLITRADTGERLPIGSLVGQSNIPVLSIDQALKTQVKIISKVFPSGVKAVFELQTRSGRTIKASANHQFITINGWQRLDQLRVGGHLGLPRSTALKISARAGLKNDELILLAHLIGDGCVIPRQPLHYTSADPWNIAIVQETARRLFNIKSRLVKQKNWWHVYLPSPHRVARGRYNPIVKWFKDLGLELVRSYEKRLPEAVFECSTDKIKLFLHHLWATDGNVSWNRVNDHSPNISIYYATTSAQLAADVQQLLLRAGILSTQRFVPQKNYRPIYQIHIQGAKMQARFCHEIGSFGNRGQTVKALVPLLENIKPNPNLDVIPREIWPSLITPAKVDLGISWRDFSSRLGVAYNGMAVQRTGVSRPRLETFAKILESPKLQQLAQSDIYWDQIVSIRPLGKMKVYDATVPGTHNFIANDIFVHNSIEQDADVVLFIYREDTYRPAPERTNVANILIEKHRNGPTGEVNLFFDASHVKFDDLASEREAPLGPPPKPTAKVETGLPEDLPNIALEEDIFA